MTDENSNFLTAEEAASLVNCNRASLFRWAKAGHLNVYRTPGGHKRFRSADLMRMLERGEVQRRRDPGARRLSPPG